jgi:E3 ubiquitin-protein ligase RGLG
VRYESLEDVQRALRRAGLEKSDLIIGIDFTKSNEWTGNHTYTTHNREAAESTLSLFIL